MDGILSQFRFGQLQDLATLVKRIRQHGYTMDDVIQYVESKKKSPEVSGEVNGKVLERRCPECGERIYLNPVNTGKMDITGDGSTFVWICRKCKYEEWENERLHLIIRRLKASSEDA